jgi:hypothetical protein
MLGFVPFTCRVVFDSRTDAALHSIEQSPVDVLEKAIGAPTKEYTITHFDADLRRTSVFVTKRVKMRKFGQRA